jgi:hypothetical protein
VVRDLETRWSARVGERKVGELKRVLAELWDGIAADEL